MTITITVLGMVNGIQLENSWVTNHPTISKYLTNIRYYSIPIYGIAGIIMAVCYVIKKLTNIKKWQIIKFVLDEFQEDAFKENMNDPKDHHRITLFQKKRVWTIFDSKWYKRKIIDRCLVPILRSGEQSQRAFARFPITDVSDENESVAARAYSCNSAFAVTDLPEITKKTTKTAQHQYAEKTFCSLNMINYYLENDRAMPRSIAAFPLTVNGHIWGVVVLDSRSPNSISNDYIVNYSLTISLIETLLEKL